MNPVGIGQYSIVESPAELIVYGLGSCAALIVFDERTRKAGLAHILLPGTAPSESDGSDLPAKHADQAVRLLATELEGGDLRAVIVGGARLFQAESPIDRSVGSRNVESLKESLSGWNIPIVWEETGGDFGRTVRFEVPQCTLRVRTLREGWVTVWQGSGAP